MAPATSWWQGEDVVHVAIVGAGPDRIVGGGADELDGDAQPAIPCGETEPVHERRRPAAWRAILGPCRPASCNAAADARDVNAQPSVRAIFRHHRPSVLPSAKY
jgi:hypothetical protein